MPDDYSQVLRPIARLRSDFDAKFGVPRQAGLVPQLRARVIFEPQFRNPDAVRGLDGFSHIWLVWLFSLALREGWSATVRPPRLGGQTRMGVFATRSPFRPNSIGLSAVELLGIEHDVNLGPVLIVGGADLVDHTPILDVKPYVAADVVTNAKFGFTSQHADYQLDVVIPDELAAQIPADKLDALRAVLAQDPRPAYQHDPQRLYGLSFAGLNVRFVVAGHVLRVVGID